MLTLTTPQGITLTADTDVRLASLWADEQLGGEWDDGLSPFDQHTAMNDFIDDVHAMQDGEIDGYTVTAAAT